MDDEDLEPLLRAIANHLFLGQFEAFRAHILTLKRRNPSLAISILREIIFRGGDFPHLQYSPTSVPYPAHLAWQSAQELLQFDDKTPGFPVGKREILFLCAEFLLLVQSIASCVSSPTYFPTIEGREVPDGFDCLPDEIGVAERKATDRDVGEIVGKILKLGLRRLKVEVFGEESVSSDFDNAELGLGEVELTWLKRRAVENCELFYALCRNLQRQRRIVNEVSELAVGVVSERRVVEIDEVLEFKWGVEILKAVQRAHLGRMREYLDDGDVDGAVACLRLLNLDYGVPEEEYRLPLRLLVEKVFSTKSDSLQAWHKMRDYIFLIYKESLASSCTELALLVQDIQDYLLSQDIVHWKGSSEFSHPALKQLERFITSSGLKHLGSKGKSLVIEATKRDLYHYSRVSGSHVMQVVMEAALSYVGREELYEASNVLQIFPLLQPLVACMGWDLLPDKPAARKKLLHLLWKSKLQMLQLEKLTVFGKYPEEVSCEEHLCDLLCYRLDLASFAVCINSGNPWKRSYSMLLSKDEHPIHQEGEKLTNAFATNVILALLEVHAPLRVLFDVVPCLKSDDAVEFIGMQPVATASSSRKRATDLELIHMRYAIQSAVLALGSMEETYLNGGDLNTMSMMFLNDLRHHLSSIDSNSRKIMILSMIVSLLHVDGMAVNVSFYALVNNGGLQSTSEDSILLTLNEDGGVLHIFKLVLDILRDSMPEAGLDVELDLSNNAATNVVQEVVAWRLSLVKEFLDDWYWRLDFLRQIGPPGHLWSWKEAVMMLRAAPSKLLNLCLQKARYDIGEETIHRFSLPPEDKAALSLAQWIDDSFRKVHAAPHVAVVTPRTNLKQEISSVRSQLGPVATVLICIDLAATSARSVDMCKQLMRQGRTILSEIYPGGAAKAGSSYRDRVQEACIVSVAKRVLQRFYDHLEQENPTAIQEIFLGEVILPIPNESMKGQKQRAIVMLHQTIEDAHRGKRQFLSGKLHNLVRALADEEIDDSTTSADSNTTDKKKQSSFEKGVVLGLGFRVAKQSSSSTTANLEEPLGYEKESAKASPSHISGKPSTYLSAFVLYIANIGDIVDGADTTHDFNFFSLAYEWPRDLITRLVFEQDNADAAGKVADIMSADLVHKVISACVPPVYPPRNSHGWARMPVKTLIPEKNTQSSSADVKHNRELSQLTFPVYPLQLNILKHLATLSPVRAVLACVFGSSLFSGGIDSRSDLLVQGNDADRDRPFYEFALDQSYRYPTLNRWIQMQSNMQRVFASSVSLKGVVDLGKSIVSGRSAKRPREPHTDLDKVTEETTFLSWDNEGPYEEAVERLIGEGKLMDALALSDRCLRNGASDRLLQLLVERGEENYSSSTSGSSPRYGGQNFWSNSWQYCLRLKDKQLAARLALKYLQRWDLDASIDVLTMCICHLSDDDPLKNEVTIKRRALKKYSHILKADDEYISWLTVESDCKRDPEGLALRLAGKGAVFAALEVAESAGLSIDLRRELQGRQLVKLLTTDPLNGGGPAQASRFLSSFHEANDALPVVTGAMKLLPDLRSKQLLVHFFLKRRDSNLSDVEKSRLNSWALGLRVLSTLPLPWQQRCSALHEYPQLILEVLLIHKQLQSASMIMKEFPSLRDDSLILEYSAKAITLSAPIPASEARPLLLMSTTKPRRRSVVSKGNAGNNLANLQKEALKAFPWSTRDTGVKSSPKEAHRKRKSSGFPLTDDATGEAMGGTQEDQGAPHVVDAQERLLSTTSGGVVLSGDPTKDAVIRLSHKYESAPDITLFKALLSLCSDESVSSKGALNLCMIQMKSTLSSVQLPLHATMEAVSEAYRATETYVQVLGYAKSQLRKLVGPSDASSEDMSDAGSSSVGSQLAEDMSDLVTCADGWLGRAELLQSLLGSGIVASLDDISDRESSARLRDRLIIDERYSMAIYTCKKCKIDAFPVWNAWGRALIRMEHYPQARVKIKQAIQLNKGDPAVVVLEIINTMEAGPPVDVSAVRTMYEHLSKSGPTILDDSLSADAYLSVLHIPSTFPRSERSRRSQNSANRPDQSINSSSSEDGPRSNLDLIRYSECIFYLQEYAKEETLNFMFRHGHYADACLLFFPPNAVPHTPHPSSHATVQSSTQKLDPLATEYGTLDDLCDLCVGHGVMPVLEHIITARIESSTSMEVIQHTAAALNRICIYCESHKHFNFLYMFQVVKKDHVASGLCCVQLFMNSTLQEEAIKHLGNAKMHFEEALSARHKTTESSKVVAKGIRGKSASEKLTEDELVKFSARVAIQVDVVKSFHDADGPPWKHSLFGNPNDQETLRRRCEVAETLSEKNFDLAFRIIYGFNLCAVDIYAAVAKSLAERKKGNTLTEFLKNIKGVVNDEEWDQVLMAAIVVYANKHRERPDRLIDMIKSVHRKVIACVICGRLKTAFQIASRNGTTADVEYVAHQALVLKAHPVVEMCRHWFDSHS